MSEPATFDLSLPRRSVLLGGGAAAVVATVGTPQGAGAASAAGRRRAPRVPVVGVLTATVPGKPAIGRHGDALVAGLSIALGRRTTQIRRVEVAGGLTGAVRATETLLGRGVDIVVAALSTPVAVQLIEPCAVHGAGLVIANAGAHVLDLAEADGTPRALHTSTQHWQAALSAGSWARRQFGKTMHVVVAGPDAGYDSVFALQRGFIGAGGRIAGITMTHGAEALADLVGDVRASKPSVIGICASGKRAAEIVRAIRAVGIKTPIVLDPLSVESGTLAALGATVAGLHLVQPAVVPERQRQLARALRAGGHAAPDAFSILGHDTGLLINRAGARIGSRSWTRMPGVLAGARVRGVRGGQVVHPRLGTVSTPLVVSRVKRKAGATRLVPLSGRPRVAGDRATLAVLRGRTAAGYVNEYLTT